MDPPPVTVPVDSPSSASWAEICASWASSASTVVGVWAVTFSSAAPAKSTRTLASGSCARMARPMFVAWAGRRLPTRTLLTSGMSGVRRSR